MRRIGLSSRVCGLTGKIAMWLPMVVVASYASARIKEGAVTNAANTLGSTRLQATAQEQELAHKFVEMQTGMLFDRKEFIPFLKAVKRSQERLWQAEMEITRLKLSLALGLPAATSPGQMHKTLLAAQCRGDRELRKRVNNVLSPPNNHLKPGTEETRYWRVMWDSVRPFLADSMEKATGARQQTRAE